MASEGMSLTAPGQIYGKEQQQVGNEPDSGRSSATAAQPSRAPSAASLGSAAASGASSVLGAAWYLGNQMRRATSGGSCADSGVAIEATKIPRDASIGQNGFAVPVAPGIGSTSDVAAPTVIGKPTEADCGGADVSAAGVAVPEARTCPSGHGLRPWSSRRGGFCDGCAGAVPAGELVTDCRRCNWYLCSRCHKQVEGPPPAWLLRPRSMSGLLDMPLGFTKRREDQAAILDLS